MIGTTISHYKVLEKIGQGGMGEVYRAEDTNLSREVAIKVLPEQFTQDPQRLARFEREAKLLAQLNHPNIAAIYGLEEADGIRFLALELVPGETLAERVAKGPMPVKEALEICRQIAEGVEAAHEKGVIHRDLKPANVKVTPEGQVKILDFGLAKAFEGETPVTDMSQSPTLTQEMTRAGMILGTAAYMSPEQAKAKPVDKRADIFAFGALLYELLTGKRAFEGETITETLAKILEGEPNWDRIPKDVPPTVRVFLKRCLEKDPRSRLRDIGDMGFAMAGRFEVPSPETTTPPPSGSLQRIVPWALAGIAVVIAAFSILSRGPVLPNQDTAQFSIPANGDLPLREATLIALSPDGQQLVYVAVSEDRDQLYLRSINALQADPIPGTDGARGPFFSPDGQWVGFTASDHSLKRVSLGGGPPINLCDCIVGESSVWGPDGTIVAVDLLAGGLILVPSTGGDPEPLTTIEEEAQNHREPTFLPNGKAVLFTIFRGSLDTAQLAAVILETGEIRLLGDGFYPRYAPTGHLIYGRTGGVLWAVPFDEDRLAMTGDPVAVLQDVRMEGVGSMQFTFADNGSMAYIPGSVDAINRTLVWVDRKGLEETINVPPLAYTEVRISPEGTRIALVFRGPESLEDIWVYDLVRETNSQLTFEEHTELYPLWTPDGEQIIYLAWDVQDPLTLFWKLGEGSGQVNRLAEVKLNAALFTPWSIAPDGKTLTYFELNPETGWDIGRLSLEGEPRKQNLLATRFAEVQPQISRDGNWLAYVSNESGQYEVYVSPFPDVESGKWRVSNGGGRQPVWSPDGRELFYQDGGSLLTVSVEVTPAFSTGNPRPLFLGPYRHSGTFFSGHTYDIAPDGEKFLMIRNSGMASNHINVVLNWFEELKRLVPTDP